MLSRLSGGVWHPLQLPRLSYGWFLKPQRIRVYSFAIPFPPATFEAQFPLLLPSPSRMSTTSSSTRMITNGGTPIPGKHDRLGYTHDDVRQYCAQFQSLDSEMAYLASKYIKKHPKPKAEAVAQVLNSSLAEVYEPYFDRLDAYRTELGLKPSKAKAPTISSDQEYELADATVRRKVELLTMFDGEENGNLEVTTSHSPSLVPEGYVPVPILETDGGRFLSVLEKQEAFVPK